MAAYLITLIIELASTIAMFFSSVLFIIILYTSLKVGKIPPFMAYFLGAFYVLTIQNMFEAFLPAEEPYLMIKQILKLASAVMILLGISEIYGEFKPKEIDVY